VDVEAGIMASSPGSGYRSAAALAFGATLLFVALAVTDTLSALSLSGQIQLLDAARFGASIPPAQAELQDARQRLLGLLGLAIGLAAWIAFLMWMYRASRAVRALGADGLAYSPG
jgi:hypothetical protein